MKFDKLRLVGFKSFVEPTDVLIAPGLTGVVGPNGCGKSNLVEALRWVMGEASYKSVRGASMDDVIFAGSGRRPSRDTAEVTLFVDNTGRTAPAEVNTADALEVTRRITRGVGSDYRINGRAQRARDVQLLFADAASGSRSPSMVRQGQVAELIAAKPTDRRNILEEAAGIGGLRARKHEAALKLSQAEANLARAFDVSVEVERQVEALRRQARQAARYKTLSEDIRTLEATVHHLRWVEARSAAREAEASLTAARAGFQEAAAHQTRAAIDLAAARHAMPPLREAEAAALSARKDVAAALDALEARDRKLTEQLGALRTQIDALAKDMTRHEAAQADAAAAEARLHRESLDLSRANEGADARIAALEVFAQDAGRAAEAAEAAAIVAAEAAATALAARKAQTDLHARAVADADRQATEVRRLEAQLAAAKGSDAVRRSEALAVALAAGEQAEADAVRAEAEAAEIVAAAEADEVRAGDRIASAEGEQAAPRAAASASEQQLSMARARLSEAEVEAKALARLAATPAAEGQPVLDACTVTPGYEVAFAAALGDDLRAPVSTTAPARWTEVGAPDDPPLAAGEPLSRFVVAPPALARRLAQVGVVVDGSGVALPPGQRLVARSGALWRWDGFCSGAGAPNAAAERLAQRNRIAALATDIAILASEREAAEARVAEARAAVATAAKVESDARQRMAVVRTRLADARVGQWTARTLLGTRRRAVAEAKQRLTTADGAAREAAMAIVRSSAALDAARAQKAVVDRALGEAAVAMAAASNGQAEMSERDRTRNAATAARRCAGDASNTAEAERRAVSGRARRLERVAIELTDWRARLGSADQHGADLAARHATATAVREALAEAPSETALDRRRLVTAAAEAEIRANAARDTRTAGEAAERTAERTARDTVEELSATRERCGRTEERVSAAHDRLQEVEAALTAALGVAPIHAARLAALDPSAPPPERAASEATLDRMKAERERLGGVNLLAERELAEIEDRRGTLMVERDDLLAGIATLRQGIQKLDREARGRLVASFDTVNSQFQRLFVHLFGGGEAELRLTEADDPLEAGLDIFARPPGKTPQVLSLLSGGEQTLTATALIFAVFLTNPAPISVLDEIDAPLDDANVERFCNLLVEMTRLTDTRFLVITHNPITMARMDRLYGVTMVEKGVSQLVSVSLGAAEELRQTA